MYAQENKSNVKAHKFGLRDIAVIETLFATGARVYEISNIREDIVNLNTRLIRLMGEERYIQSASSEILDALKNYYKENSKKLNKAVFSLLITMVVDTRNSR